MLAFTIIWQPFNNNEGNQPSTPKITIKINKTTSDLKEIRCHEKNMQHV